MDKNCDLVNQLYDLSAFRNSKHLRDELLKLRLGGISKKSEKMRKNKTI